MEISRQTFIRILVAVTAIKIVFAFIFPIKNDEAYYVLWAQHLSSGYYDHPPMIAWLLRLMSYVSGSIVWYRMLAISAGLVGVWVIYRFALLFSSAQNARFAAMLFVLSPLYILLFLISNDAPLLLFSSLGVLLFYLAVEKEQRLYALGSGVLLGAAFLSKYLVAPLGIAIAIYSLAWSPRKRWPYLALATLGALPFLLQHLYYNYTHDWNTLNFHFFLRNAGASASFSTLLFYFLGLLLMMTPWAVGYLATQRKLLAEKQYRYLLVIVFTSTLLFALASLKTVIGLHFFLVFAPYLFALYAIIEAPRVRKWLLWLSGAYAVLWIGLLVGLAVFPLDRMQGWKYHADFVLGLSPKSVCEQIAPWSRYPLFSDYYATAAILSYECDREVNVLFSGSRYGREFDRWTDFESLDGKTIVIVSVGRDREKNWLQYFRRSRTEIILVRGAPFTILVGEGFKFGLYREKVLNMIKKRYYQPPAWLPRPYVPLSKSNATD
ncbi:MAG: ArnT family glycosyltransferase [Acidiferrobacterales bacterium]